MEVKRKTRTLTDAELRELGLKNEERLQAMDRHLLEYEKKCQAEAWDIFSEIDCHLPDVPKK